MLLFLEIYGIMYVLFIGGVIMDYWDLYFGKHVDRPKKQEENKIYEDTTKEYEKQISFERKKTDKRLRLSKSKFLLIMAMTFFTGACVGRCSSNRDKELEVTNTAAVTANETTSVLTLNDLYEAINSNDNLNENEKKVLDNVMPFLQDYSDYISYNDLIDNLSNFDIVYENRERTKDFNLGGTWSRSNQLITLYNSKEEDLLNEDSCINHEMVHLLCEHKNDYPRFFTEGLDALVCEEYGFDSFGHYPCQVLFSRMLCEVIDPEIVMESYIKQDFSIIRNELLKIDSNEEKLDAMLNELDNFHEKYRKVNQVLYFPIESSEEQLSIANSFYEGNDSLHKATETLLDYYKKKTGKKVERVNEYFCNITNYGDDYNLLMNLYYTMIYGPTLYFDEEYSRFRVVNHFEAATNYFNKSENEQNVKVKVYSQTFHKDDNGHFMYGWN